MNKVCRILLIEDNPGDARLIEEMLKEIGDTFELECAERLSSGIEQIKVGTFDAILLDLGLPDSQGLGTLTRLNDAKPEVPVVVLTGLADESVGTQAVKAGAQDYLIKGQIDKNLLARSIHYAVTRKKMEEAQLASELRYRRLFEAAKDGIIILDAETGMIIDVNAFLIALLGFPREAFFDKAIWDLGFLRDIVPNRANFLELQQKGYVRYDNRPLKAADGRSIDVEFVSNVYEVNRHDIVQCNIRDITKRKQMEDWQHLAHKTLMLLTSVGVNEEVFRNVLAEVKKTISFDAVAIRLREGDDFPYYVTAGFSEDFLRTERFLCVNDAAEEIERDGDGTPALECMCGNILRGRTDPELPFFTKGGSFWTNSITQLMASATEAERQTIIRMQCNGEGYESVALIPLQADGEKVGLLQLNDHRPNQFTLEMISFFEGLASSIAVAVTRRWTQEKLNEEKTFTENALNNLEDMFIVFDLEGRFLRWNKTMSAVTGYSDREIASMKPADFVRNDDMERLSKAIQLAVQEGNASIELVVVTKDVRLIPHEFRAALLRDSSGTPIGISAVGRDITERKKKEEELGKLTRILQARNDSSRVMIEAEDEHWYLTEVCRIIVEDCGHTMVWIGFADDDQDKTVRPVAYAGFEEGYLESANITWADKGRGRGPTGTAIRTGKSVIIQNTLTDIRFAPWRAEALRRGYASMIGVPLLSRGKAFGALNIYSRHANSFTEEEASLLTDLAADLSYGISAIRLRSAQEVAEKALRKSEKRYRSLFKNMSEGLAYCRMIFEDERPQDFIYLDVNSSFEKLTGLKDVVGRRVTEVIPGIRETDPELFEIYGRVALTGRPESFEVFVQALNMWFSISAYRPEKGYFVAIFDVITERKQAAEALAASERKYRLLHETMRDAFVTTDMHGRITECNKAYREMLGYSEKELLTLRYVDITPEKWRAFDAKILKEEILARGFSDIYEREYRRKDGTVFPIELRVYLTKDESGNPASMWAIVRDITERKKAEQRLAEAFALNKAIFDSSPIAILTYNASGQCLSANKAAARAVGATIEKLLAQNYRSLESWRESGMAATADAALSSGKEQRLDTYHVSTFGRKAWYACLFASFTLKGEPHLLVMISDISDRRQAEEALRVSERQYRQLVDNALVGVYRSTPEGKFLYVNDALAKILEYEKAEEVLRLPVVTLYKKPEDREAFLNVLRELGKVPYFEVEMSTKTGKLKTIVISASLEDGKITGMITDITERTHLEAQLRHAQKMEAIGTLAGGIAHDFNNILNVILGYGILVRDSLEAGSLSKERMDEVLTAADRAAALIRRLLAFSRKQLIDIKPFNISELILGLQKMLIRIIGEDIDLQVDLADRPLVVLADFGQIEQVLMNLATNARDAMPEGGRLTICTGLEEIDDEYVAAYGYGTPGMYAIITVSDTGSGMDEETQKKMFEPFYTTKGVGEGTGLGLAISYGIIKQHGGYIKGYSEPGQGTVFKIYLPLIEEAPSGEKKTEAPDTAKGGDETILMAEDDASLRNLTRIVLESSGYSVITAEDGEDAIIKYIENRDKIALVILDMIMPKKSGKEVSNVIRKVNPAIKILFFSGYAMDTIKTEELTESGFEFIHKPVRPQRLLRKVREVLNR